MSRPSVVVAIAGGAAKSQSGPRRSGQFSAGNRTPAPPAAAATWPASARRTACTWWTAGTAGERTARNVLHTAVVPRVERQRLHRPHHFAVVHVERHHGVRGTRRA